MPRITQSTAPRWIVDAAKIKQLNAHPRLSFKSTKLSANSYHVTHVSDGGQWVDMAAAVASMVFPELAPLIGPAAAIGKHFLKKSAKSHGEHDKSRVERHNMPSVSRAPEKVALQPNLVATLRQNVKPVQSATNPVRFAPMPVRLNAGDVPVLHGQNGHMPLLPVTTQRTESHATMAGSEYLGTLQLLTSQTGVGLNVYSINVNPRSFSGTKLTNEARTWQMYRFRKFVVEYIPIQGSSITGSFVGYFTNDPFEADVGGVQAVRNAVEHTNSLMFQPFFHSIMAFTDDEPLNKHLYFTSNESESDPRFEIQSVFKIVQNVSNTTAVPFGSFIMHYEIDFYYPETTTVGATTNWTTSWTGDSAPTASQAVNFNPSVAIGSSTDAIYAVVPTVVPANGNNCFFFGDNRAIAPGQTVYLRPTGNANWHQCYSSLAAASQGTNVGRLFYAVSGGLPGANASWTLALVGQVAGETMSAVLASMGEDAGLTKSSEDETQDNSSHGPESIPLSKLASYQFISNHHHANSTTTTNPCYSSGTAVPDIEDIVGPPRSKYTRRS